MISKAQIQLIRSLRQPEGRAQHGLFVVEGVKMVEELLRSDLEVVNIFAVADWQIPANVQHPATMQSSAKTVSSGPDRMDSWDRILQRVEEFELQKISSLTTPNKVLALATIPQIKPIGDLSTQLVLLLDHISDPGNMGTIIRTAEWFGINRVIASDDSVDFYNPKVVQASMGSVFRMALHSVPIIDFLQKAIDIPVYGTLFDGEPLGSQKLTPHGIIIIGNESHGISQQVQAFVTRKLTVPAALTSASESLNASIATAIVCFEFRKQFPVSRA